MCNEIKKKYKTNGGFKQAVSDMKKMLGINSKSFKNWNGVCELFKKHNNNFFTSKQAEYIFYLTKLEGKQRNKLLGLKDEHYEDKEVAKKWYREIAKLVHPDKDVENKYEENEAFNTLNKIYQVLIEEED